MNNNEINFLIFNLFVQSCNEHVFPVFAVVEQGTLTVQLESGKTFEFPTGSSFSEVIDVYHCGSNSGKSDVVLLAFYLGEKVKPLSIHQKKYEGMEIGE